MSNESTIAQISYSLARVQIAHNYKGCGTCFIRESSTVDEDSQSKQAPHTNISEIFLSRAIASMWSSAIFI